MGDKTYIDEKGYLRFKDSNKLVHRWVVEKEFGRKLRAGEEVHHKDGNKLNNDPNNLEPMWWEDHVDLHDEEGPGWMIRERNENRPAGCSLMFVLAIWSFLFK